MDTSITGATDKTQRAANVQGLQSVCYRLRVTARYTVKQVAALTGVLETTLRVWERRYGVVDPARSPGGYRLYSDDDVARLRTMAGLVAEGAPASVAARTVREHVEAHVAPTADLSDLDLVAAAASLDPSALDALLNQAFARAPLDEVCQHWLMPELQRVGAAWASGRLTVSHEHFASAGVTRILGRIFGEADRARSQPRVLIGLPPGAHHALGLLAFATCLRHRGVDVVYVGADVPVAAWVSAAAELRPRGAIVGVPRGARTPRSQEVVNRLLAATPPISVWVGGGRSGSVHGAHHLPHGVADAAAEVAAALASGLASTLDKH